MEANETYLKASKKVIKTIQETKALNECRPINIPNNVAIPLPPLRNMASTWKKISSKNNSLVLIFNVRNHL